VQTFKENDTVYFYTHHNQNDPFYKGEGVIVHVTVNGFSETANYEIKPNVKFGNSGETIFRTHLEIIRIPQNEDLLFRKFNR
jgi:hypothetical protein